MLAVMSFLLWPLYFSHREDIIVINTKRKNTLSQLSVQLFQLSRWQGLQTKFDNLKKKKKSDFISAKHSLFQGCAEVSTYGMVPKGLLTFLGFLGNAEFSPCKRLLEFIELRKSQKSLRVFL